MYCRFSKETIFQQEYFRTNATGGRQNMRCFPQCSYPIHREYGYCGNSVIVELVQHPSLAKLYIYGKFEESPSFTSEEDDSSSVLNVHDTIEIKSILTNLRSLSNPMNSWLDSSQLDETKDTIMSSFFINHKSCSWHYGWNSRDKRLHTPGKRGKQMHQLSVFVFIQDPNNAFKYLCINKLSSPPFQVLSTRSKRLSKQNHRHSNVLKKIRMDSGRLNKVPLDIEARKWELINLNSNKSSLKLDDGDAFAFTRQLCCIIQFVRKLKIVNRIGSSQYALILGALSHFIDDNFILKLRHFFNRNKLAITKRHLLIEAYREFLLLIKVELSHYLNIHKSSIDEFVHQMDANYLASNTLAASYPFDCSANENSAVDRMTGILLFVSQMRQVFVYCKGQSFSKQVVNRNTPHIYGNDLPQDSHDQDAIKLLPGDWKCNCGTIDLIHLTLEIFDEPILGLYFMVSLMDIHWETTTSCLRLSSKHSIIPNVVLEFDLGGLPSYTQVGISGLLLPIGSCGDYRTLVTTKCIEFESYSLVAHQDQSNLVRVEKTCFRVEPKNDRTFNLVISLQCPEVTLWMNRDKYYNMNTTA